MRWRKDWKDNRRKRFTARLTIGLSVSLSLLLLAFFYPKSAGSFGTIDLDKYYSCSCFGFMRTVTNVNFASTRQCYGIPHGCESFQGCVGAGCWRERRTCRCTETGYWTESQLPCLSQECPCTHGECERIAPIGR